MSNNGFGAPDDTFTVWTMLAGWPIKALSGGLGIQDHYGGRDGLDYERNVLTTCAVFDHVGLARLRFGDVPQAPIERRLLLPYGVEVFGFAINTIFYAAIVWMLFAVPGAVRRRVRIRCGQCASCGYSLPPANHRLL